MTRKTIADNARDVMLEHYAKYEITGDIILMWGDLPMLDEIVNRAKVRGRHPLVRHGNVLNAHGRSSFWQQENVWLPTWKGLRIARRFRLKAVDTLER